MPSSSLLLVAAMRGAPPLPRRGHIFPVSLSPPPRLSMVQMLLLNNLPQQQQHISSRHRHSLRYYYTNTDTMKRDDPYQQLGLQWGDGATSAQIREAYRRKAAELHPDVNRTDSPVVALRKFQDLQRAYQTLLKVHNSSHYCHADAASSSEQYTEWSVSIWRNGDRIAMDRADVAGVKKQRPKPSPATAASSGIKSRHHGYYLLGHPDGSGRTNGRRRGEYLTAGDDGQEKTNSVHKVSSSVGRGLNKWVQPKAYVPWNGKVKVESAAAVSSAQTRRNNIDD